MSKNRPLAHRVYARSCDPIEGQARAVAGGKNVRIAGTAQRCVDPQESYRIQRQPTVFQKCRWLGARREDGEGEERVHFALNCMSVGCPRLPREPFLGATLNQQLDDARRFFFSERRNLQYDQMTRTVRVSSILKFYTDDFLRHSATLVAYINQYSSLKIPENAQIEYIPYDWTVNTQTRRCLSGG